jgi:hypothetical protein
MRITTFEKTKMKKRKKKKEEDGLDNCDRKTKKKFMIKRQNI